MALEQLGPCVLVAPARAFEEYVCIDLGISRRRGHGVPPGMIARKDGAAYSGFLQKCADRPEAIAR